METSDLTLIYAAFSCATQPFILQLEMGIHQDNLSAIIYYRLSLSLKIVRRYIIAINDSLCAQCSKSVSWRYGKIHSVHKVLLPFTNISFCFI